VDLVVVALLAGCRTRFGQAGLPRIAAAAIETAVMDRPSLLM